MGSVRVCFGLACRRREVGALGKVTMAASKCVIPCIHYASHAVPGPLLVASCFAALGAHPAETRPETPLVQNELLPWLTGRALTRGGTRMQRIHTMLTGNLPSAENTL